VCGLLTVSDALLFSVDHMTICSAPVSCWSSCSVACTVFVSLWLQQPIKSDSNHQVRVRLLIHLMSLSPARLLIHLISQFPARLLIHLMNTILCIIHLSSSPQMAIHVQVWGSLSRPVINHKTMFSKHKMAFVCHQ